ncbi:MAG TPA: M4 family metallopeptidase, partial [Chitinophagaceae bacterium]|nr:M4 family metallopeptidase [Chitinophagaceae bacterium]
RSNDELGMTHIRLKETFEGIPVQGTMYILHTRNQKVESVSGVLYNGLENLSLQTAYTSAQCLQTALQKVNAQVYKWQLASEEAQLKKELQNPQATYFPQPEKCILKQKDGFHLCYAFNIYAQEPFGRTMEYVDAHSGQSVFSKNLIQHINSNGTAVTKYSGTQPFQTDSVSPASFRLRDASRGLGVRTYNLATATSYGGATDFTDADNYWNNVNAAHDEAATDAHWGAQKTYDYFWNKHNRNSIDGAGYLLNSYVHYNTNYANAFWDGTRMTYGDGNLSQGFLIMTGLDVCGHEIGHGLTNFTSDLSATSSGTDECDALNEAYSDVFGTAVEKYARPSQWDWIIGGDITCTSAGVPDGVGIRNMSNPTLLGQPKCYQGTNWSSSGEPHDNDGPLIYWYYLLSTGYAPASVTALGTDTAAKIAFRTNTVHLFPNADYADARFYSILSSSELYGACSTPTIATTNAWAEVCVGNPYVMAPTVSAFSGDIVQTCDTILTVQFSNNSVSGNSFIWDFGDGDTSSVYSPSHTYTTGVYTVKLYANGGTCGSDTSEQIAYIQVGPPAGPATSGATICTPASVVVSATPTIAGDSIKWYTAATGGTLLGNGNNYTTPVLSTSTTYYAEEVVSGPVWHVGPLNNSIGTGGNYTNTTRFMVFDCSQPVTLVSVWVYASSSGNRTIILKNAGGTTLQSVTVNIPTGGSVVTLNMPIPVGTGLQLGLATGSTVNLYRNSTGAVYPYTNGPISITGNTAAGSPTYYYFFYDWVIKAPDCYSVRTQATVIVATGGGSVPAVITPGAGGTTVCSPATVTLSANTGAGLSYQWYNGSTVIPGA